MGTGSEGFGRYAPLVEGVVFGLTWFALEPGVVMAVVKATAHASMDVFASISFILFLIAWSHVQLRSPLYNLGLRCCNG